LVRTRSTWRPREKLAGKKDAGGIAVDDDVSAVDGEARCGLCGEVGRSAVLVGLIESRHVGEAHHAGAGEVAREVEVFDERIAGGTGDVAHHGSPAAEKRR
jgi:hypothetical protein